ncbi:MAG: CsbD family protein [Candidatus Limnocylindria bacterium]
MGESKFDEMKGRAKEAAGDLTDDDDLKKEGKIDRAGGAVKDKVDKAADKVKDAVDRDR